MSRQSLSGKHILQKHLHLQAEDHKRIEQCQSKIDALLPWFPILTDFSSFYGVYRLLSIQEGRSDRWLALGAE